MEIDEETRRVEDFVKRIGGRPISEDELAAFAHIAGFVEPGVDPRTSPMWESSFPHRQALASQYLLGRKDRTLAEVASFDRPVLLVKGSRSSPWLKAIVDVLGDHFPRATVLELDGTHACHLEKIDEFMEAFDRHLTRPDAPSRG
jgi:pimeloyl-ACP methyl ester carboxylesterase